MDHKKLIKKLYSIKNGYLNPNELSYLGYIGLNYDDENLVMYLNNENSNFPFFESDNKYLFKTFNNKNKRFFNSYQYSFDGKIYSIFNRRPNLDKNIIEYPTRIYYRDFPYNISGYEYSINQQLFVPKNLCPSRFFITPNKYLIDYEYALIDGSKNNIIKEFIKENNINPLKMTKEEKSLFLLNFNEILKY